MNSRQPFLNSTFLIVVASVFIIFGVSAYWLVQQSKVHSPQGKVVTSTNLFVASTTSVASTALQDAEILNWQTYQNDAFGFTIKYPNSFAADKTITCDQPASDVPGYVQPPPEIYKAGIPIQIVFRDRIPSYTRDDGFHAVYDGVLAPATKYCEGYLLSVWVDETKSDSLDLKTYLEGLISKRVSNQQIPADKISLHEYNSPHIHGFSISTPGTDEIYVLRGKHLYVLEYSPTASLSNSFAEFPHTTPYITFSNKLVSQVLSTFEFTK